MKVLHVIDSLSRGGAEILLTNLLPKLKAMGVDIVVVSRRSDIPLAQALLSHNIAVHSLIYDGTVYDGGGFIKAFILLKEIVESERPDIVHSHLWLSDVLSKLACLRRIPLISTLHNVDPWWLQKTRIRSVMKTKIESYLAEKSACYFVACSNAVLNAARCHLGILESKIRTIYNGIDLGGFSTKESLTNRPVILHVGRLEPRKGQEVSLRAFQLLKRRKPEATLWFVGSGNNDYRARLQDLVNELGVGDVKFFGVRQDVPQMLFQGDVFWMPSDYEGLPISCLEAMACGLPVVATDVSGINEVVQDGVTGYMVGKRDHVMLAEKTIALFEDPMKPMEMGRAGRRRVEDLFSIDKTAEDYFGLYRELVQ